MSGLAVLALVVSCSAPPPKEAGYVESIVADRNVKDDFFATAPGCHSGAEAVDPCSPVPPERRAGMLPLAYYEPDPAYRVPAALKISEDQPVSEVPTSTGTIRQMQKVGTLQFRLNGEPRTLSAFVELPVQNANRLFVPFRDATSGSETYPAGRYLDLDRTSSGVYDLDFNRAYHPYCYYDERYECPFPPLENRLSTAVRAGERLPEGEAAPEPSAPEPSGQ